MSDDRYSEGEAIVNQLIDMNDKLDRIADALESIEKHRG